MNSRLAEIPMEPFPPFPPNEVDTQDYIQTIKSQSQSTPQPQPQPQQASPDHFLGMNLGNISVFGDTCPDVSDVDFWLSDNTPGYQLPFVEILPKSPSPSPPRKQESSDPLTQPARHEQPPNALLNDAQSPSNSQKQSPVPLSSTNNKQGALENRTPQRKLKRGRKPKNLAKGASLTIEKTKRTSSAKQKTKKLDLPLSEKRRIRAERNRESAEKSRIRRKQYTYELETSVVSLRQGFAARRSALESWYTHLADLYRKVRILGKEGTVPNLCESLAMAQRALFEATARQPASLIPVSLTGPSSRTSPSKSLARFSSRSHRGSSLSGGNKLEAGPA